MIHETHRNMPTGTPRHHPTTAMMIPVEQHSPTARRNVSLRFPDDITISQFREVADTFCLFVFGCRIGTEVADGSAAAGNRKQKTEESTQASGSGEAAGDHGTCDPPELSPASGTDQTSALSGTDSSDGTPETRNDRPHDKDGGNRYRPHVPRRDGDGCSASLRDVGGATSEYPVGE